MKIQSQAIILAITQQCIVKTENSQESGPNIKILAQADEFFPPKSDNNIKTEIGFPKFPKQPDTNGSARQIKSSAPSMNVNKGHKKIQLPTGNEPFNQRKYKYDDNKTSSIPHEKIYVPQDLLKGPKSKLLKRGDSQNVFFIPHTKVYPPVAKQFTEAFKRINPFDIKRYQQKYRAIIRHKLERLFKTTYIPPNITDSVVNFNEKIYFGVFEFKVDLEVAKEKLRLQLKNYQEKLKVKQQNAPKTAKKLAQVDSSAQSDTQTPPVQTPNQPAIPNIKIMKPIKKPKIIINEHRLDEKLVKKLKKDMLKSTGVIDPDQVLVAEHIQKQDKEQLTLNKDIKQELKKLKSIKLSKELKPKHLKMVVNKAISTFYKKENQKLKTKFKKIMKKNKKVHWSKQKTPPLVVKGDANKNYQLKRKHDEEKLLDSYKMKVSGNHCDKVYQKCMMKNYRHNPCYWKENGNRINYKCGTELFHDDQYRKIRLFWFKQIYQCDLKVHKCYFNFVDAPKVIKVETTYIRKVLRNPLKKTDKLKKGFLREMAPNHDQVQRQKKMDKQEQQNIINKSQRYSFFDVMHRATQNINTWYHRLVTTFHPKPTQ